MSIKIKRAYQEAHPGDGQRILVDRLWPRGLSRKQAAVDEWLKSIAPSDALRKWFNHDPEKWSQFKTRYFSELESNPDAVKQLRSYLESGTVTLLYAARETRYNNARALKAFLEQDGTVKPVEEP